MFGCIFWICISYRELMCQITPPRAWPRFAVCVLRQIDTLVPICFFAVCCLFSMDYKGKKIFYVTNFLGGFMRQDGADICNVM